LTNRTTAIGVYSILIPKDIVRRVWKYQRSNQNP